MARELKPHGTRAAYNRHRYYHEDPCDACKAANAEYVRAQSLERKKKETASRSAEVAQVRESLPAGVDDEQILLESLTILRAQQQLALPQAAASIAKGIRETLEALRVLREPQIRQVRAVSVIDEIAQRRRERADRITAAKN